MSFEADQARLVKELADAQAQVRAHYGLAPRAASPEAERPAKASTQGKRSLTAL